jgi:hypothetical protein
VRAGVKKIFLPFSSSFPGIRDGVFFLWRVALGCVFLKSFYLLWGSMCPPPSRLLIFLDAVAAGGTQVMHHEGMDSRALL